MVGRFAIGIMLAIGLFTLGTHPEARTFAKISDAHAESVQKMDTNPSPEPASITEALTPSPVPVTEVTPAPPTIQEPVVVSEPQDNETIIWDHLVAAGYTRNQTAGIMGNLFQEHKFATSDVPGGLGIAQWMGNRRANLMARPNYLSLSTQLDFLVGELNGVEQRAMRMVQASTTVEDATIAFQDGFERCGVCMQHQRIQYAYDILGRH